jgi:methyl-accepting chemotaxis protein
MKINDISIKWQLLVICIFLVSIPVIILGIVSYNAVKNESLNQIEESMQIQTKIAYQQLTEVYNLALNNVDSSSNVVFDLVVSGDVILNESNTRKISMTNQVTQGVVSIDLPLLTIDGNDYYNKYELVDKYGKSLDCYVTIFQAVPGGILRISTNVVTAAGARAIGTFIPSDSPVYQAIMKGEEYKGRAFVAGTWMLTSYKPLYDVNNKVVGSIFTGVAEDSFKNSFTNSLTEIVIGETGYFYILDKEGNYVLSLDRKRDGENIKDSKDARGNLFIQEIIENAVRDGNGNLNTISYDWRNAGESFNRQKTAVYTYFSDWEWIISSSIYDDEFLNGVNNIRKLTIYICIISIIIGSIIAYFFAIYMTRKFDEIVDYMNQVAKGDLTINVNEDHLGSNELGQMGKAFSIMLTNLKNLVLNIIHNANTAAATAEQLSASAQEVNASAEQVSSTVQKIAKGNQTLNSSANETKKVTEKLISAINSVAKSANESAKEVSVANETAKKGSESAKIAGTKMNEISNSVKSSGDVVKELGIRSEEIGKVVEVINSISEQTNLLALNAAIEAARAGDAGRGFAVVADEVRKLAEESQKATKQIETIIQDIIDSTKKAVVSMDVGSKAVDEGNVVVQEALGALTQISEKIAGVAEKVEHISNETKEQLKGSEIVQKSVNDVSIVAEESAAGSEEVSASMEETTSSMQQVASSAQDLSKGAEELKQLVSKFKVDGDSVQVTKKADIYKNKNVLS